MESLRLSNPEAFRAALKERRLQKTANGICVDCPRIAADGRVRCGRCLRLNVEYAMRTKARQRRRERLEEIGYRPLDEVIDLTRVRVLRGARSLDWFSTFELNEELGYADDRERNKLGQMLNRLARAGLFDRRLSVGGIGLRAPSSKFEYRITPAGLAELDQILRGAGVALRAGPRRAA